jgi:hypothetical protein
MSTGSVESVPRPYPWIRIRYIMEYFISRDLNVLDKTDHKM